MVLPENAADKLDGEIDKQEHRAYWMNFKEDAKSLPKLPKGKGHSLYMHE